MKALRYMIENDLWEFCCDPWQVEPGQSHYESVEKIKGQITYRNEIFIIVHSPAVNSPGGMAMGTPKRVRIFRVKK